MKESEQKDRVAIHMFIFEVRTKVLKDVTQWTK